MHTCIHSYIHAFIHILYIQSAYTFYTLYTELCLPLRVPRKGRTLLRWTLEGLYRSPALFNAYGESLRETADKTDTEDFCFLREMQEEADGAGRGLAPQDKKNKKDATGKKAAAPMQAHSKAVGTRRLRMQDFVLLLADVGVVLESVRARAACERASIVPSLYLSKLAHRRASTHAHTHTFTYKHTYIQTHIHAYIYIYIYRVPSAAHQHMHTHTCRCLPSAISLVEGWGEGAGSRASAVAADGTRYI